MQQVEQILYWVVDQGRWVEIAIVGAMILVSLMALKMAVSVAARLIVLFVALGLVGGGLYCLNQVRKKRQLLTFRIEARGKVVSVRRFGLKRRSRCDFVIEGTFRRMALERAPLSGTDDDPIKVAPRSAVAKAGAAAATPQPGRKGSSRSKGKRDGAKSDVEPPSVYAPVEARCKVTVRCGDEIERRFDERGECTYFHDEGLVRYSCEACPEGGLKLDLRRKRAELTGRSTETKGGRGAKGKADRRGGRVGRARFRLWIKHIQKPMVEQ